MPANTTASLKAAPLNDADFQRDLDNAKKKFAGEKLVKKKINPSLAQKVGSTLPMSINGVTLVLPVDGTEFQIPETFAKHLEEWQDNLPY